MSNELTIFFAFILIVFTIAVTGVIIKRSYDATIMYNRVKERSYEVAKKFKEKTVTRSGGFYGDSKSFEKALIFRLCDNPHVENSKSKLSEFLLGKKNDYAIENMFLDEFEEMVDRAISFQIDVEHLAFRGLIPGVDTISTRNLTVLLSLENNVSNFSLKDFFEFSLPFSPTWGHLMFEERVTLWVESVKEHISIEKNDIDGSESIVINEDFIELPYEWQFDLVMNGQE